jgi:hypothetical protein
MKLNKSYMTLFGLVAVLGFTACGGGSKGGVNQEVNRPSRNAPNHVYDMADYLVTSRLNSEMTLYKYTKLWLPFGKLLVGSSRKVELIRLTKNEFLYEEVISNDKSNIGLLTIKKDTIEGEIGVGFMADSYFVRPRYIKVGDKYDLVKDYMGINVSCTVENHYNLFDTGEILDKNNKHSYSSEEEDVLEVSCIYSGMRGKENLIIKDVTYYAKGQGYILRKSSETERGFETISSLSVPSFDVNN